jgi:hypothetical protein
MNLPCKVTDIYNGWQANVFLASFHEQYRSFVGHAVSHARVGSSPVWVPVMERWLLGEITAPDETSLLAEWKSQVTACRRLDPSPRATERLSRRMEMNFDVRGGYSDTEW